MDTDSILGTTKLLCGLDPEDPTYDLEFVTHINSVLFILQQLGVGPETGHSILDKNDKWSTFIAADQVGGVRTYMGLKVRLLFDPPSTGPATEAMERQAEQLEWRLNIQMEGVKWDRTQAISSSNMG